MFQPWLGWLECSSHVSKVWAPLLRNIIITIFFIVIIVQLIVNTIIFIIITTIIIIKFIVIPITRIVITVTIIIITTISKLYAILWGGSLKYSTHLLLSSQKSDHPVLETGTSADLKKRLTASQHSQPIKSDWSCWKYLHTSREGLLAFVERKKGRKIATICYNIDPGEGQWKNNKSENSSKLCNHAFCRLLCAQ